VHVRAVVLTILGACFALAQTSTYVPPAPVQPLPFSHKQHVSNGLDCKDCHAMPEPGDHATFPGTAKCMACHVTIKKESAAVQKLAEYHKNHEEIPWKRVYRVPDIQPQGPRDQCEGSLRELSRPGSGARCDEKRERDIHGGLHGLS
jgi:hypothetical protein